jgi:hypothetical protein
LKEKVKSGVDAAGFDSWGGMLSPVDYKVLLEVY